MNARNTYVCVYAQIFIYIELCEQNSLIRELIISYCCIIPVLEVIAIFCHVTLDYNITLLFGQPWLYLLLLVQSRFKWQPKAWIAWKILIIPKLSVSRQIRFYNEKKSIHKWHLSDNNYQEKLSDLIQNSM